MNAGSTPQKKQEENNGGETLYSCLTTKTSLFLSTETRKVHDVRGEIQRAFGLVEGKSHTRQSLNVYIMENVGRAKTSWAWKKDDKYWFLSEWKLNMNIL